MKHTEEQVGATVTYRGRWAAIVLSLLSPLILYLIIRVAAAATSPALAVVASGLPPQDKGPLLKQLVLLAQQPKLPAPDRLRAEATEGLKRLPLSFEPFFIAGRVAEVSGDRRRAIALMEEARRRRPTYAATRMQLLVYYTQEQRYSEALSEMDVVMRRNEEVRKRLLPELSKLIGDPRGREALATILAKEPEWRADFFGVAAGQKIAPRDASELYRLVSEKKRNGDTTLERQLVLQAQARSGNYAGARATWLAGLPANERSRHALIFDGAFRGLRAAKPFGWDYQDVDVGRAEPARDGGRSYLDVAYFGGRDVALAEQVLALTPGRYTLRVRARADAPIRNGSIAWRLRCLPSGNDLAALDLTRAETGFRPFQLTFAVPQGGCAGQNIRLVAEAGDVAGVVNLELSDLEISR